MRHDEHDAVGWWSRAACVEEIPDLFFPEPGSSRREALRAAIDICARCPVLVECFHTVMSDPSLVGIWAATDEQDRARARALSGRRRRTDVRESA